VCEKQTPEGAAKRREGKELGEVNPGKYHGFGQDPSGLTHQSR